MKFPDFTSATCSGIGIEFFFPEDKGSGTSAEERMAKRLCLACPVLKECREWGMRHELYGIWGGMSPRDRMVARRKTGYVVQQILVADYVNTK